MIEGKAVNAISPAGLPKVKICGLTRLEDAQLAADLGAFALGFVFYPPSPRAVAPAVAAQIVAQLPETPWKVGVFVNADPDTLRKTAAEVGLTHLQLHGDESPALCAALMGEGFQLIKALRPRSLVDFEPWQSGHCISPPYFLLDAAVPGVWGGSGQTGDWELATHLAAQYPVFLAGGLNPENILAALQQVHPWALDLSSGLEVTPGLKDPNKLHRLFEILHSFSPDTPERNDSHV